MRQSIRLTAATAATWVLASLMPAVAAPPGVSLNAARVGAVDVAADAKFYQAAFGLQEVRRFEFPGGIEVLMNFGATADAAKANNSPQVVVMHRNSDATQDPIPHLIFTVTDIKATVAAIKAAGGKMDGEPREFGKTGIMIGMAIDPAGNHIEMIQQPKQQK
jgi:predicted enzyme related to lactoylglutathione lyase